jgi:hypothetical protein
MKLPEKEMNLMEMQRKILARSKMSPWMVAMFPSKLSLSKLTLSNGIIHMEGFKVGTEGSIVRMGVAEEPEVPVVDQQTSVSLGHGHQAKHASNRYSKAVWEQH